jgi:hypothetical protein
MDQLQSILCKETNRAILAKKWLRMVKNIMHFDRDGLCFCVFLVNFVSVLYFCQQCALLDFLKLGCGADGLRHFLLAHSPRMVPLNNIKHAFPLFGHHSFGTDRVF